MIDLGVGHSIAIYERNGTSYVAEFREGRCEIMSAGAWFRHYSGGLRYCHNRRAALQRSMPLNPEILAKSSDSTWRAKLVKTGCWLRHGPPPRQRDAI
jgi:hypothetical protein